VINFLKEALKKYTMVNKVLPSQIAIYRDGVGGPSYQKYVVEFEIPAVEGLLKGM